jgi:predicted nuclease of predicted toxin-antitoxin system
LAALPDTFQVPSTCLTQAWRDYIGRDDLEICASQRIYYRNGGFHFVALAEARGSPPKIVQLEKCDYKTWLVEEILRRNAVRIAALEVSPQAVLILRRTT